MNMITLHNASYAEATALSNVFIDDYMPEANGEFVKVYIYLLRILSSAPVSFSLEQMADRLLCTERDILRALKYWDKANLISIELNSEHKICGITLLTPHPVREEHTSFAQAPTPVTAETSSEEVSSTAVKEEKPVPRQLTPDRIKELKQNEEIVQLLYIAEQYLGKTLSPTDIQKILFFYDELHFSSDLIEYLIEYCVGHNHKSIRYIESVATAWASQNITTVEMAKNASSRFNKDYFTILKSLGISGRNPVDTEISLMDNWLKEYGFTLDIIQEACNRTVLQTGQPSFQYADKILREWKDKSVKSLNDIRILDAEHKKRKLEKASRKQQPSSSNRFNNFQQRNYDFSEYEKRLLNK